MKALKPVQPLSDVELMEWEATRNMHAELLESIGQMVRGETLVVQVQKSLRSSPQIGEIDDM